MESGREKINRKKKKTSGFFPILFFTVMIIFRIHSLYTLFVAHGKKGVIVRGEVVGQKKCEIR